MLANHQLNEQLQFFKQENLYPLQSVRVNFSLTSLNSLHVREKLLHFLRYSDSRGFPFARQLKRHGNDYATAVLFDAHSDVIASGKPTLARW